MSLKVTPGLAGTALAKIAATFELPDYVKSASTDELVPQDRMNPVHYARLRPSLDLPMHNKAACWLSAAKLSLEEQQDETAMRKLVKRAAYLGIADDLRKSLLGYQNAVEKSAATEEAYPVRNEKEAIAAQQWLLKNAGTDTITSLEVHYLADKIQRQLGDGTLPEIKKMAGYGGVSDIHAFAQAVGDRVVVSGCMGELTDEKQASTQSVGFAEINGNLPSILKKACEQDPHGKPWEAIQHDEPVYKVGSCYYPLSRFENIPRSMINRRLSGLPIGGRERLTKIAEGVGGSSADARKEFSQHLGTPVRQGKTDNSLNRIGALLISGLRKASRTA